MSHRSLDAWRHAGVTAPVIGASKPHRPDDAVAALDLHPSPEGVAALEAHHVPQAVAVL